MSSDTTKADESQGWQQQASEQPAASEAALSLSSENPALRVDARGLEPPGPMVAVLEALSRLAPGQSLLARTDRRPMHLYAQLEARGYRAASEELPDGSVLTRIEPA